LRGAAQLSGQLDGDQINLALGLETVPYHPLNLLNKSGAGITNWLIFGVSGEMRNRNGAEGNDNNGI
jgi:hypothetical protein